MMRYTNISEGCELPGLKECQFSGSQAGDRLLTGRLCVRDQKIQNLSGVVLKEFLGPIGKFLFLN